MNIKDIIEDSKIIFDDENTMEFLKGRIHFFIFKKLHRISLNFTDNILGDGMKYDGYYLSYTKTGEINKNLVKAITGMNNVCGKNPELLNFSNEEINLLDSLGVKYGGFYLQKTDNKISLLSLSLSNKEEEKYCQLVDLYKTAKSILNGKEELAYYIENL